MGVDFRFRSKEHLEVFVKDLSGPKIGIGLVHSALVQTPVVPSSSCTTLTAFSTRPRPYNDLNRETSGSRFPGSKRPKIYTSRALDGALPLTFGLHFLKQPFSRLDDLDLRGFPFISIDFISQDEGQSRDMLTHYSVYSELDLKSSIRPYGALCDEVRETSQNREIAAQPCRGALSSFLLKYKLDFGATNRPTSLTSLLAREVTITKRTRGNRKWG
jgi:hypothetical protein